MQRRQLVPPRQIAVVASRLQAWAIRLELHFRVFACC